MSKSLRNLLALFLAGAATSELADENVKNLAATHGVFSFSASDHKGLDGRAVVMVRVEKGAWKLLR